VRKVKTEMPAVLTIGHSTHTWEDFLDLLRAHRVERVIDIRSIPRSRHNPQFNRAALSTKLRAARIGYVHLRKLGGLRHARRDSPNMGWRNTSFRGFADYMQTSEFEAGLHRLIKLAGQKRSAMMCAEAVPWRCHRSVIADALTVGFIAAMVFSVGQRILPSFCGMRVLWSPRLMLVMLVLLMSGCTLRVTSEILAYQNYAAWAWNVLPISALIELTAVTLFAVNLILTFLRPPVAVTTPLSMTTE
jgi:Protein of unknown function, DUF488